MTDSVIGGKYEVLRQLGEGGMGAVYEARHLGTGRRVAVKVIGAQALAVGGEALTRFEREARASGAIDSEHVVQVLDSGVDEVTGNPYMVMELLAGEDVQQLLRRIGPLAPEAALRVVAQACIGLHKAHAAGIVHRDLKSANLFLQRRDNGGVLVKLFDFGIAKVRADQFAGAGDHGLTRTGAMIGSPLYMSPEQAKGSKDIDHRSDIWSLGVVLYEALSGAAPNAELTTIGELIIAICAGTPRPIQEVAPWVSADVAAIVHRALSSDPGARFTSAARLALTCATAGQRGGAMTSPPRAKRRWIVPVVLALVAGAGAVAFVATRGSDTEAPKAAVAAPPPAPAPAPAPQAPDPTRTVEIAIAPADAAIDVDGAKVTAKDGTVELHGAVGSVHHVTVEQGGRSTSADVVIAATGPVPTRVELPPPVEAATKPTGHKSTHTTTTKTPAQTKTTPSIDRSFN